MNLSKAGGSEGEEEEEEEEHRCGERGCKKKGLFREAAREQIQSHFMEFEQGVSSHMNSQG